MNLDELRAAGFDSSYEMLEEFGSGRPRYYVKCSQCEALVINGVPTHETGCTNIPKRCMEDEDE